MCNKNFQCHRCTKFSLPSPPSACAPTVSPAPNCKHASRMLRTHARWVARARLDDYLVAAGAITSGLPVIGRHLEPVAGMAALGMYGLRYVRDFMTSAQSRVGPGAADHRRNHLLGLGDVMTAALADLRFRSAVAQRRTPTPGGLSHRGAVRRRARPGSRLWGGCACRCSTGPAPSTGGRDRSSTSRQPSGGPGRTPTSTGVTGRSSSPRDARQADTWRRSPA